MKDNDEDILIFFTVCCVLCLVLGLSVGGVIGHGAGQMYALADLYQKQNKIEVKQ